MVRIETSRVISKNEEEFVGSALDEGLRIDDRSFTQFRRLTVGFGRKPGQCDVCLGRTRVITTVRCRAVEPSVYRPKEGFLDFEVKLSPMADPVFQHARKIPEVDELKRLLDRVLKNSKAVDVESLCLIPGKQVWSIRVDITVVDHDGNVTDACGIATLTALLHFRKPDVTIQGDRVIIHPETERESIPLNIQHVPIIVTFAIMKNGSLLVDPTAVEAKVATGELSIAVNTMSQICVVHKVGGDALPQDVVLNCATIAVNKVDYIVGRVTSCIADDELARKKAGLSKFSWAKDRMSVGDMEKLKNKQAGDVPTQAAAAPEAKRKRARSLSPDDPDVQATAAPAKEADPASKKAKPSVSLSSSAKLTLCVPDGSTAAKPTEAEDEEVEEIEEIEEVEEVEEVPEDEV
eukprot:TRINITY_DN32039_c0_g1_i2.p1 TRINITY_DN32039_c0_g1~~TRINITY_DN32039_c0_g1_i2.p1  ORF type:complete len:431 (+),score=166.47 TRINITY_DN32039_c0_g1_i2:78-1295(+)